MTLQTTTIRPGFLVSLRTSVTGNTTYTRRDVEPEHNVGECEKRAKWETEKRVRDADEQERATTARGKARLCVESICTKSGFGLLCPQFRKDELDSAIKDARRITDDFNATSTITRLYVGIIVGRIADNDVEAAKEINREVRDLLEAMDAGLRSFDVDAIRDAASRAKGMGQILSPEVGQRVELAISAARAAAKRIVKAGETAAKELDQAALRTIATARTAFLDLDAPIPAAMDTTSDNTARAIDLDPNGDSEARDKAQAAKARALDLDEPTTQAAAPQAPQFALGV